MRKKEAIYYQIPTDQAPKAANFTFIDLFAGIGGIRIGFESAGGKCVFTSECDAAAQKTYQANFKDKPYGNITKISSESNYINYRL